MISLRRALLFCLCLSLSVTLSLFAQSAATSSSTTSSSTTSSSKKATPIPTPTPRPSTPTPTPTPAPTGSYCPLPVDYGIDASNTNSPEKPKNLKAVCHHPTPDSSSNYIILCLPPNAYSAHIQHGDTPIAFNCTKAGNSGPCGP